MKTIRDIIGGTDRKTIDKWVDLVNSHGPEKTAHINVFYWIKRDSIPPQLWDQVCKAAGDQGMQLTLKDLYDVWVSSRAERLKCK